MAKNTIWSVYLGLKTKVDIIKKSWNLLKDANDLDIDNCFIHNGIQWLRHASLLTGRSSSSSIVLDDSTIWILGYCALSCWAEDGWIEYYVDLNKKLHGVTILNEFLYWILKIAKVEFFLSYVADFWDLNQLKIQI